MAANDFGQQGQFAYIYDALASKYPAVKNADGTSTVFQFTASPLEATWATGSDLAARDFANTVSQDLSGYYTPGGNLYNNYQTLIFSIQPADYTANPMYEQYQAQLGALNTKRGGIEAQMKLNFETYQQNGGKETGPEWANDMMGGLDWQQQVIATQTEIDRISSKIVAIVGSMDNALGYAQTIAKTADQVKYVKSDGSEEELPRILLEGDLSSDVVRWAAYPKDQFDFDVTINKSATITSPWKTIYTRTVEHNCFGSSVHTDVDVSRIIADENYKLVVKYRGLESYQVTLGGWYTDSYVNPKTDVFAAGNTVTSDTFFGLNGSMHLIPSQVWIAFQPSISLTITTELFKEQYSAFSNADVDWIDILGTRFDMKAGASLQPVDNGNSTTTITFNSPVNAAPQVLGVTSTVKYNGNK
jgi:hypothetical protein